MYSSRGSSAYGQQSYAGQSTYGANLGPAYSTSSVGGPDGNSQQSLASRHSSMLGGSQEADVGGYRAHPLAATHYGGQYSSVYGASALSSAQQVPATNVKGAGPSILEGRGSYASVRPDSPKFASSEYVSSSGHGFSHKGDQFYAEKVPEYAGIDRRQYGDRQSTYLGRDLQSEPTGRYADSLGLHQNQNDMYDRIDQALLRQEQLLKAQSLQSASLDGTARQADYLAARGTTSRHPTQDLLSYGGRVDADPRSLSMLSASSYSGQQAPSILGAAPRRNMDDLVYTQSSSNPGYGVSLPPGRDYATGKGLHGTSLELDYPSSTLSRGGHTRIDDHKDDRAGYLREFELREEERRREHLRERERDREREKERERERDRERERERRILERREKERDWERKRGLETRHDRTPPRVSRDRRGSSLAKEGKSLRRNSPHRDALHRRHSPVKEKRREYVCKVYSSSLVDVERDYLSIDKRYPRLFVSPEFSKAVVHWPKENLKLPIHSPVSFEHEFIEEDGSMELKGSSSAELLDEETTKSGNTVWNAKMILMSGLSKNAMEELSSEKSYDNRIPHICNIIRFAVLRKDKSFMAIGGPWNSIDGGDPSVDDTSLVRTAIRHAKNITPLDLQNCCHWNRFLEIHYDRIGSDGLFSHKEVTVLFVPDLSDCLPSLEAWKDQWFAHKKAVTERERQLALKKERSRERKDGIKDKDKDSTQDLKKVDKSDNLKMSTSSGQSEDVNKKVKDVNDVKGIIVEEKVDGNDRRLDKKGGTETGKENVTVEKKEEGESVRAQKSDGVKPVKKKIIKKIVKQKVVDKTAHDSASKQNDNPDERNNGDKNDKSDIPNPLDESSGDPAGVKTFVRKKVIRKVPVVKTARNEDIEDKPEDNSDPCTAAVVQGTGVKTTVKKKIIKRVAKRKVEGLKSGDMIADTKKDVDRDEIKVVGAVDETENMAGQAADADNQVTEIKRAEKKMVASTNSKTCITNMQDDMVDSIRTEKKTDKDDKSTGEKSGQEIKVEIEADKQRISLKDDHSSKVGKSKDVEKSKDEKEKNDNDGIDESRNKSKKELKEKRKPEESPRHPGLMLQTKCSKDLKLQFRSVSLSLDSILDYTDKDIDESSFELSLFAESLYEMLQYQMGCRLLTFLEKLRIKFVAKRNQRKRQRDEAHEKERDKKSPAKRLRTNELHVKKKSVSTEIDGVAHPDANKTKAEDDKSVDHVDELKMEDETDADEDPEEDPEEYEEMEESSMQHESSYVNYEEEEEGKTNLNAEPEKMPGIETDKAEDALKEKPKAAETKPKSDEEISRRKDGKADTGERETSSVKEVAVVDKELLQAFRFFDRNRVGYIRVEDMRLMIHNLGKFLSHRDVKELVQSALLESNTGRDDRILYNKLVRMSDI